MRAVIKEIDARHVVVESDDDFGNRIKTEYYAPLPETRDAYIRINDRRENPQVCEGLARRGPTLVLRAGDRLIDVIRREHRAAMAARRP